MSAAQQFPALVSADSSRAASPAASAAGSAPNPRRHNPRRHKKGAQRRDVQPDPAPGGQLATPAPAGQPSSKAGTRRRPRKAKAAAEASDNASSTAPGDLTPAGDARRRHGRKTGAQRRAQQTPACSESAASLSRPASSLLSTAPAGQPAGGTLPMPTIIAGEDGRARVVFGAQPEAQYHHPPPPLHEERYQLSPEEQYQLSPEEQYHPPQHRFYGSAGGYAHEHVPPPAQYAPHAAPAPQAVGPPPGFRHRAMTSMQLHADARPYPPQLPGYHRPPAHPSHAPRGQHRLSLAGDAPLSPHVASLAAEAGPRGRSQSVSTHFSSTSLRISLAQSQPGNVMSPHLPLLARGAYGAAGQAPQSAYASGGYFASRRASVSNVGLAVDPSHSIRIPTILFQRSRSTTDHHQAPPKDPATGEPITPQSGDPAAANDGAGLAGEDLAMQRLQEMISSLRALGTGKTAASAADAPSLPQPDAPLSDPADAAPETPIAMLPTPAAHPTSRFDSILEEDEDTDDDDDDAPVASSAPPAVAARPASALCAL